MWIMYSGVTIGECMVLACAVDGDTINYIKDICYIMMCYGDNLKLTARRGNWKVYHRPGMTTTTTTTTTTIPKTTTPKPIMTTKAQPTKATSTLPPKIGPTARQTGTIYILCPYTSSHIQYPVISITMYIPIYRPLICFIF